MTDKEEVKDLATSIGPTLEPQSTKSKQRSGRWMVWFVGGSLLSFLTVCSLVLFMLAVVSISLNLFLAIELSGWTVALTAPPVDSSSSSVDQLIGNVFRLETATSAAVAVAPPDATSTVAITFIPVTNTPPPPIANSTPQIVVVTATPMPTPIVESSSSSNLLSPTSAPAINSSTTDSIAVNSAERAEATSNNVYKLIPLERPGDGRNPEEHGDLNLSLREPTLSSAEPHLVDYDGGDYDPNAPKLSPIFDASRIVKTYTVHNWDWGCNCKGSLKNSGHLIGLEMNAGDPIFIPRKQQDIYLGQYYAVVLYASENSLTFVYSREGTVANAYVVHYHNLNVDPNLVKLFRERTENQRPGLTLDTPIGTAKGELMISVRDKGRFLDTRSRRDWW